jgi:hypothetical protein
VAIALLCTFMDLVYSQFKLKEIQFKKVNYNLLLFLGAYKFNVLQTFFENHYPPPPGLPKLTQLLPRRYHVLYT